jgi:hypothetical protein
MNYSAEKLAVIFGCTVSDIMDINKEILFEKVKTQCPLIRENSNPVLCKPQD